MSESPEVFCSQCGASLPRNAHFCASCGAPNTLAPGPAARPGPTGKPTGHIKYRNMFIQVILYVITLGIYAIYWYYVTLAELDIANGNTEGSGCIWTVLLLIPIANLFAWWHYSTGYARFVDDKYPGIAIFILWIVFAPAAWFLVQLDLNRAARGQQV